MKSVGKNMNNSSTIKKRKTYNNNTLIVGDKNNLKIAYYVKGGNLRPDGWKIDIYAEEKVLKKIVRWVEKETNISFFKPTLTLNYSKPVFESVSYKMLEAPRLTNIMLTTCYEQVEDIVKKLEELNHG